ncbi:putative MET13-putative methylene tetrahydrofolate reductase [Tilletiaria anomala UBC 951]|uniref:Putative MET13-putative methylene tetrahydrofolate reductase n=1 Tax=Tilletiaria anomala (strain ATCC 24038 / CBS 436.72 / UBC 951) TaxID=1037660 RepID=A0A066VJJ2_TILAU|nr:putative MET13-putative methylene tetrahydrofolate reductase [Tilletiaria anomala UBC 951]KDN41872.1 putative MET13-putative methylene tetrahydrofolate reductase [Tilletiaria anomala UBC 951]
MTSTPHANWRITDKIAKAERDGSIWWSFEYFPPRTSQGLTNLYDRIERMGQLGPEFVDITFRMGSADLTYQLVDTVHSYMGLETCMHLTCTNMPRAEVDHALDEARRHGCRNILALRGDPPLGKDEWEGHADGFTYAKELVEHIRAKHGDYFAIAVAGFPEGHIEAKDGEAIEMQRLKDKVDAGADFIFTQMFYDYDIFDDWVRKVRRAGITCPIVPGVMPIQNYGGFQRAVARFRTKVPQEFYAALEPVKDDDQKVREVGTRLVGDMCRRIIESDLGIHGLHIYTMNLERGPRMLLDYLGLTPDVGKVRPIPWTPSLTPKRRDEGIRPIFWANRAKSYISRTETWDEFPNGRWGDARSPAYGDFDAYGVQLHWTPEEGQQMWGSPQNLDDIRRLFCDFCAGKVKALPWTETGIAKETSVINDKLVRMNQLGFLTINSQPAVDSAKSTDPVHGWGPKNGYVYQKAYLEFFVSPEQLDALITRIESDAQFTYHAVNARGDMRTNTNSESPNAVTWGVFPHCEIIQPTIVESISFLAWKDEAYQLGREWAKIYPVDSVARKVINDTFDRFFLVNIVHNDFKRKDAIFEPFFDVASASNGYRGVNGSTQAINDTSASLVHKAQGLKDSVLPKTGSGSAAFN